MSPLAPWTAALGTLGVLMVVAAFTLPGAVPVLAAFGGLLAGSGSGLFALDVWLSRKL